MQTLVQRRGVAEQSGRQNTYSKDRGEKNSSGQMARSTRANPHLSGSINAGGADGKKKLRF
jgi:hypothetical protein